MVCVWPPHQQQQHQDKQTTDGTFSPSFFLPSFLPSVLGLKSLEIMRKFSEQYAKRTNTYFCSDKGVTAVVIKGLAEHKDTLGAPLCPCRHYEDKEAEVAQGFWNCPCVPMRERKECHCMLFLTDDNPFTDHEAKIGLDELVDLTGGAKE